MNFISKGNLVLTVKNLLLRAQVIQECFPNGLSKVEMVLSYGSKLFEIIFNF